MEGLKGCILKALKRRPSKGFTASELYDWFFDHTDLEVNYRSLTARLSDLVSEGLAEVIDTRKSTVTGYNSNVYVPAIAE